jgi:hypothetical protein
MVALEFCRECENLLKTAEEATHRHIEAVSRLQLARINGEYDLASALRVGMSEAAATRERATAEYHVHRLRHRSPFLVPVTPGVKLTTTRTDPTLDLVH